MLAIGCRRSNAGDSSPENETRANLDMVSECLDHAAAFAPDFICLPEIVLSAGIRSPSERLALAEPVPGPSFDMAARKAAELRSHVILPLLERVGDAVFNSAALIDRDGRLMGVYRKYHATGYEIEEGVTPGAEVPVWETDCGRVGIMICFDLKFPAVSQALSRQRAQCVFWPTMFMGGRWIASRTVEYGFHIVRCHAAGGRIVDAGGAVVAEDAFCEPLSSVPGTVSWCAATLNLDHRTYHLDFHKEKIKEIGKAYAGRVEIRRLGEEGLFRLIASDPGCSVDEVEREFGLRDLRAYLDDAAAIRETRLRQI